MVTGSGRGIGKQIVLTFAERGANVIITDLRENEEILQVVKDVEGMGVEVLFLAYDVSKLDQIEEAIKKAVVRFGRIDILVNNVGVRRDTLLMRMKEEEGEVV